MNTRWLTAAIAMGVSSLGLGINHARAVLMTHASQCAGITKIALPTDMPASSSPNTRVFVNAPGQVVNMSTDTAATLFCPVELDNGAVAPVAASAHAWKNSSAGVKIALCHTFAGGGGGSCGTNDGNSSTGAQQPLAFSGFSSADYNYIKVTMSACSAGNCNVLFGYNY
jgi:hypothetical protein